MISFVLQFTITAWNCEAHFLSHRKNHLHLSPHAFEIPASLRRYPVKHQRVESISKGPGGFQFWLSFGKTAPGLATKTKFIAAFRTIKHACH